MIAVIPTGGANLNSVQTCLKRLGYEFELTENPEKIVDASHVLLPGVGYASHAMKKLREKNLDTVIRELKQPVLGICLGMQIMFESSEEGDVECLGLIPGKIKKIPSNPGFSIPHMGWNELQCNEDFENPYFLQSEVEKGIGKYCYFVHSFQAPMGDHVEAYVDHGVKLPAIVRKDNFYGMQFHPERSASLGADLLKRFFSL